MSKSARRNTIRLFSCPGVLLIMLTSIIGSSGLQARGYYYDYPNRYLYRDGLQDFALRQDVTRLRGEVRRQQSEIQQQTRLQQEQLRLLRQQTSEQQRVSAMQACYYRYDAGLDLCDDLFAEASPEQGACYDIVVEKNPGCARDITKPQAKQAE